MKTDGLLSSRNHRYRLLEFGFYCKFRSKRCIKIEGIGKDPIKVPF